MLLPCYWCYFFFFFSLFLCGQSFRLLLLSSVLQTVKEKNTLKHVQGQNFFLTFNPTFARRFFPSVCGHTLLSISHPRAFIFSCYLLLHPAPPTLSLSVSSQESRQSRGGGCIARCSAEGQDLCHLLSRRTPFIRPRLALCLPAGSVSRSAVRLLSKERRKRRRARTSWFGRYSSFQP